MLISSALPHIGAMAPNDLVLLRQPFSFRHRDKCTFFVFWKVVIALGFVFYCVSKCGNDSVASVNKEIGKGSLYRLAIPRLFLLWKGCSIKQDADDCGGSSRRSGTETSRSKENSKPWLHSCPCLTPASPGGKRRFLPIRWMQWLWFPVASFVSNTSIGYIGFRYPYILVTSFR